MLARSRNIFLSVLLTFVIFAQGCSNAANNVETNSKGNSNETITVGYQSPTAQTWGALIIKNQGLYEKYLKENHPDKEIKVEWFDATAGSILNNNMVGGKIQLSFLGDLPALLNAAIGLKQPNYNSVFIAFDGKGLEGINQSILVPKESEINSIEDLKGKTVSTPIGSSAHRMLLDALGQNDLVDQVEVVDQSVTVGMQSIEQKKIAAHATWEPYPSLIETNDVGEVLLSGEETKIDYLDGVVANADWAKENRSYVIAFLQALDEAHQIALKDPEKTAKIFQEESKYPYEICLKMAKNIRFDSAIYQKDLDTLDSSIEFLTGIDKLDGNIKLEDFVDESYLKEAIEKQNKAYLTEEEFQGEWVKGKVY
ncbi:ABC transporter substrate-binding protein [Metabacillus fastidiosus]|uniref:ABC transporter substrate-binding protein n=1 Tax=Metabacillus fastidiosus TaxID=1458 RepID=UPI002DBE864E|nr:ABC transporter substrate-binding protein [Metabacillus fastidiosus]MEC2077395.1 ABC transporter substrate-binding protein [Metabacillus fastidiosus]